MVYLVVVVLVMGRYSHSVVDRVVVVRVVVGGGHGVTVHLVRTGTVPVVMSRHVTLHVRHRA